MRRFDKTFFLSLGAAFVFSLTACSTNPATGDRQFTALMSPAQEQQVGTEQHQDIVKTMGVVDDAGLRNYVSRVGQEVAKNTERPNVSYTFTVLDSPMVNAFALPGGYVYVTRGLLALANNEAELAAVLGHEVGHITARHSAERYSQNVVATLGTAALGIALDSPDISRVAGIGSQLYLKSYSRGQEHEADTLGIRYLHRAGFDQFAMASFLSNMDRNAKLEAQIEGNGGEAPGYLSTHPLTEERYARASQEAAQYAKVDYAPDSSYLNQIDGMIYGDSPQHGFAKGQNFYHPKMGFTFSVPKGFRIYNGSQQVTALSDNGSVIVFDAAPRQNGMSAAQYLGNVWMEKEPVGSIETININGMNAATASFQGQVNRKPVTIQLVAIEWASNRFFRFQVAIPNGLSQAQLDGLKSATYSLRPMSAQEKQSVRPDILRIVTAGPNDTVRSLSARFPYDDYKEERFRVLNGMKAGENVMNGFRYKVVTE